MAKKINRLEPTIADAFARLGTLDMSDRDVERASGLPGGWLTKTRQGKNRDERAANSLAKLCAWLATQKHAGKGMTPVAASAPAETTPALGELATEIEHAKTQRKLGTLLTRVMADYARGALDAKQSERLESMINRRSSIVKLERLERADKQVRALRILTPREVELLRVDRERLAGPPLQPGEAVPAPIEVDEDESEGGAT